MEDFQNLIGIRDGTLPGGKEQLLKTKKTAELSALIDKNFTMGETRYRAVVREETFQKYELDPKRT